MGEGVAIYFDPKELDEQYTLDKETIVRNWFFVGHSLSRIKRSHPSPKLFGQEIKLSEFALIPNHDRSSAIWLYEHWKDVLNWLEASTGGSIAHPFGHLASINASHPAHIKRKVREWQAKCKSA